MTNERAPAPAPAADAGERAGVPITYAEARQIALDTLAQAEAERVAVAEAEARVDSIDAELWRTYADLDAAILRADAAEAESERLRADRDGWKACADESQSAFEAEAFCSMDLRRQIERLRGALERIEQYDCADKYARAHCGDCASCVARAALAATPRPAEAGTGASDGVVTVRFAPGTAGGWRVVDLIGYTATDADARALVDSIRAALAALDQDQEADHAAH